MNLSGRTLKVWGLLLLTVIAGPLAAQAQTTYFYFNNETGLPDSAIYINLTAATNYSGLQSGSGATLNVGQSVSLAQLMGSIPGSNVTSAPVFSAQTYYGGAQIFITAGQPYTGTSNPPNTVVSGLLEEYVTNGVSGNPALSNNNLDTSYVNGISMPVSFSVKLRNQTNPADNGTLAPLNSVNPVATPVSPSTTQDIFNALNNDPLVPDGAKTILPQSAGYGVLNTASDGSTYTQGKIYGTTNIQSSSGAGGQYYRDWSTPETVNGTSYGALIPTMTTDGNPINVGSYQVPVGGPQNLLPGTLFGFSAVQYSAGGAYSPFNPNNLSTSADPNNLFLQAQTYNLVGNFLTNLNPGNDPNLASLSGVAGLALSGSGSEVGNFAILITNAQLNNPAGLYGANPQYTVVWTPTSGPNSGQEQVVTQNGSNNLVDRVVGDTASVINMGGADNNTTVWAHAMATGTTANLAGSIFDPSSPNYIGAVTIAQLTSGQFFYLLSLQQTPAELAAWFGAGIQSNPLFYNNYGSDFIGDTNAYTYAYSDRLGNPNNSPDLFYTPPGLNGLDDIYIEVDLQPGDFFYAVPETNLAWLMPFLLGGLGAIRLVRSRRLVA